MPSPNRSRPRRGVTLLELVIVITLMALTVTVVVPALRVPANSEDARARVLAAARRQAIRRAEGLRLTMATDGRWRLATSREALPLDSGTTDAAADDVDVHIDALGGCLPAGTRSVTVSMDPMTCLRSTWVATP